MSHRVFAQQFMQSQKMMNLKNARPCVAAVSNPQSQNTVDLNEVSKLIDRMTDGRSAAFVATQAVAEGADPKLIKTKCYMPGCSGNGTATYADFKKPANMKEYTLSGMCQVCQDEFFG
jgi:hypothetical protein